MIRKLVRYCTASRKRLIITVVIGLALIGVLIAVVIFIRQHASQTPTIKISSSQLQTEIDHKNTFYKSQHNTVDQQTLRSDTLQQLARDNLVYKYAQTHDITVPQSETDVIYQQHVDSAGSEQQLLDQLNQLYGITKQQYRTNLTLDILKDKVQSQLGKPLNAWLNQELPHYHIVVTK